jgi:hypothetical protein
VEVKPYNYKYVTMEVRQLFYDRGTDGGKTVVTVRDEYVASYYGGGGNSSWEGGIRNEHGFSDGIDGKNSGEGGDKLLDRVMCSGTGR